MCEFFRIEGGRDCVLWVVCLSRTHDLSGCPAAQRFSVVNREQENGLRLCCTDGIGILRFLRATAFNRHWGRDLASDSEWCLFDSNSSSAGVPRPVSPLHTAVALVVPARGFRWLEVLASLNVIRISQHYDRWTSTRTALRRVAEGNELLSSRKASKSVYDAPISKQPRRITFSFSGNGG
jgi:hypothetical protein